MRKINASLVIEDKDITVNELQDIFTGITNNLKLHLQNINEQVTKASKLINVMITVMKDGKSASIIIPEIEFKSKGLKSICNLVDSIGFKLDYNSYVDSFDIFASEFLLVNGPTVKRTNQYLTFDVVFTKLVDDGVEQKNAFNSEWQKHFHETVLKEDGDVLKLQFQMSV